MIDLHLHSTASDGTLAPAALVARAAAAGLTIISLTDHDTVAGLAEAGDAAASCGLRLIPGIEISAVERGRDVHVLGYFFDAGSPALLAFLERQRGERLRRVKAMIERLAALGMPIDGDAIVAAGAARAGRTIGRPQIADALVAAGYARDRGDAFDRWLGAGRPGYVPRQGATPSDVFRLMTAAGGISSLAHPGLIGMDELIGSWAADGLTAIEVRHSDHDQAAELRYREMAARLGVGVSGGSDFHGDGMHRTATLGVVSLPPADFADLESRIS